jgi:hypothetical protein
MNNKRKSFSKLAALASFLTATTLTPVYTARAETFNDRVQFAFKSGSTSALDGQADAAWNSAPTVYMEDGGTYSAGSMKGMVSASKVFLWFDVEDKACDPNIAPCSGLAPEERNLFDENDLLVVAFNINNTPSGYRRIVVRPCDLGGVSCPTSGPISGQIPFVSYSTGTISGGVVTWTQQSSGQGAAVVSAVANAIRARTRTVVDDYVVFGPEQVATRGRWQVEMEIDRAALGLPASGFFGFFADAVSVSEHNAFATQYTWPSALQVGSTPDQAVVMAADQGVNPPQWGMVTLDPTQLSGGLQITGFYSNQTDPTKIALNLPNQVFANVAHYPTSTPPPATTPVNARVRFKIANFGLNPMDYYSYSNWSSFPPTIPPGPEPVTAAKSIPTGAYVNFESALWQPSNTIKYPNTVSSPLTQLQFFTNNLHQCIQVIVENPLNSAVLVQRQFNMDFKQVMSPFESQMSIEPRAWEKMVSKEPVIHLREIVFNTGKARNWNAEFAGAERISPTELALKFNPRRETVLKHSVLADKELRLNRTEFQLSPKTALGGALIIPVKAGSILTMFADGSTRIGDMDVPATGLQPKQFRDGLRLDAARTAVLSRTVEMPRNQRQPGTVVGSFDGFKTSFVIGASTSVQVPRTAKQLAVRVDNGGNPNLEIGGEGFKFGVIATPLTKEMINLFPSLGLRGTTTGNLYLPIGFNLPTYMVRGELQTGYKVKIGDRIYDSVMPMGSFGHMVNYVAAQ